MNRKKIFEAERLMGKLMDLTVRPVLCFGGGRESVTLLLLARHLGLQDVLTVRIADVTDDGDGIIPGLKTLVAELGFDVDIMPGRSTAQPAHDFPLASFPLRDDGRLRGVVRRQVERLNEASSADWMELTTNWAKAVDGADGVIVGWRQADRGYRSDVAQLIGKFQRAKDGRFFTLPLFHWLEQDLNEFLGL